MSPSWLDELLSGARLPGLRLSCVRGRLRCQLRSLWRWSCRPRPEHVTLLFKSVCESLFTAVQCGVVSRLCSFLSPCLSRPQLPALPLCCPRGSWRGNLGAPQAKTRPQKPSLSRTRRVSWWEGGALPPPSVVCAEGRAPGSGQQVQCECELTGRWLPTHSSWLRELPNPGPALQPAVSCVLGTACGT